MNEPDEDESFRCGFYSGDTVCQDAFEEPFAEADFSSSVGRSANTPACSVFRAVNCEHLFGNSKMGIAREGGGRYLAGKCRGRTACLRTFGNLRKTAWIAGGMYTGHNISGGRAALLRIFCICLFQVVQRIPDVIADK